MYLDKITHSPCDQTEFNFNTDLLQTILISVIVKRFSVVTFISSLNIATKIFNLKFFMLQSDGHTLVEDEFHTSKKQTREMFNNDQHDINVLSNTEMFKECTV